jgi:uncharacterized membrane protein HdeD (DUF308 family)
VIAGIYILAFPLSGTVTLTFVLAAGALSVILGFLIAVELPSSAAWAIGLLVGINLIFWGARALIGARLLKQFLESR